MSNSWLESLWTMAEREAATLKGKQILKALRDASEEVWAAGLDHEFVKTMLPDLADFEDRALAFDITWMGVFVEKLSVANEPDPIKRARKALARLSAAVPNRAGDNQNG